MPEKRPITVVIPSAGAVKEITQRLIHSIADYVDQIILFDNLRQYNKKSFPENVLVIRKNNLFVNPAWMKGAEIARNNYLILMNDDILFNHNEGVLFDEVIFELENNMFGVLGTDNETMVMFKDMDELPEEMSYEGFYVVKSEKRNENWGAFIALKKNHMVPIHKELLIYFGDDIIYHFSKLCHPYAKQCAKMCFKWYHRTSSTSSLPEIDLIRDREIIIYDQIIRQLNDKLKDNPDLVAAINRRG